MKQKSENQKAFPRFLGILVVASLIGGVLGGLSGVAGYFWEDHTAFGAAFAHLLGAASPWAMAACAAVLLGLGLYQYRKSRTAFHGWDGEDEDVMMQRAEERLSWALLLDSLTVIVSFFFSMPAPRSCPRAPMAIRSRCWWSFWCHCTGHPAPTEDGGPHQEDEPGKAGQRI